MRLAQAGNLAPKGQIHEAEGIDRRSIGNAIVDGVNGRKRILVGESLIEPRGSEIFTDCLLGIIIGDGDSAAKFRSVGYGPQLQQRLNAGNGTGSRCVVRYQRHVAQAQALPEAFIVAEQECFVFLRGPPSEPPNTLRRNGATGP